MQEDVGHLEWLQRRATRMSKGPKLLCCEGRWRELRVHSMRRLQRDLIAALWKVELHTERRQTVRTV